MLMQGFEPSTSVSRNRHSNHMTNVLLVEHMDKMSNVMRREQERNHPYSPPLDTSGKTQARTTLKHLASDYGSGDKDFLFHMKVHSESGLGQTGVTFLGCWPTCCDGFFGMIVCVFIMHKHLQYRDSYDNIRLIMNPSSIYLCDCWDEIIHWKIDAVYRRVIK